MTQSTFKFSLRQSVKLSASGETGTILARCEYTNKDPAYLLRYTAADGRAVECWWDEDALELA